MEGTSIYASPKSITNSMLKFYPLKLFFNQDLYFRKTNNDGSQPWMRAILENSDGNVKIENGDFGR